MKRAYLILITAVALALASCQSQSYSTFSKKYPVLFVCDCQTAPYNQLSTPSRFLSIRKTTGRITVIDPDSHSSVIELGADRNAAFSLGLAGLIMGTPCFNNDSQEVWAYDLGCPECDKASARLTVSVTGMASCPVCAGQWDLNNSGFATAGSSRPLYRYPVTRNSTTLTVSNH